VIGPRAAPAPPAPFVAQSNYSINAVWVVYVFQITVSFNIRLSAQPSSRLSPVSSPPNLQLTVLPLEMGHTAEKSSNQSIKKDTTCKVCHTQFI